MNFKQQIKNIENQVIPVEIKNTYNEIFDLMFSIKKDYLKIELSDEKSFNAFKAKEESKISMEEYVHQLDSLRFKEQELLDKEKKLQDKILRGISITEDEEVLLDNICEKKQLISKNMNSVLKKIVLINHNVTNNESKRIHDETSIEQLKEDIKDKIEKLVLLINRIEDNNMGYDRLDNLEVRDKHFEQINKLFEKENVSPKIIKAIDSLFESSMDINISFYKNLYVESLNFINCYKKHYDLDFDNFNILADLYNSKVWDMFEFLYPYPGINNDLRHIVEYSEIIEQIRHLEEAEVSKEEVKFLEFRIQDEMLKTDMSHNFLSGHIFGLTGYIDKIARKYEKKKLSK